MEILVVDGQGGRIGQQLARAILELKGGLAYSVSELRVLDQEGCYRWYRLRATLQRDEQGRPARAVGIILDIDSERRKTQRLGRRLNFRPHRLPLAVDDRP